MIAGEGVGKVATVSVCGAGKGDEFMFAADRTDLLCNVADRIIVVCTRLVASSDADAASSANGEAGVGNVLDVIGSGIDSALLGLGVSSIDELTPDSIEVPDGFHRTLGAPTPASTLPR